MFSLTIFCSLFSGNGFKPVDMKDNFLLLPMAVVGDQDLFYVLDKKAMKVFAFDRNRQKFSFGRAGQGPGEFNTPASMAMAGDLIFCLERFSGRVNVFDKNGRFTSDFKLQSPEGIVHAGAIAINGEHVLISYNHGPHLLKIFDRTGELLQIVDNENIFVYPVSNNFEMELIQSKNLLVMYSRFDGLIVLVSLADFSIIDTIINRFPSLDQKIDDITKTAMKRHKKNAIISVSLFYPLIIGQEELISIYTGETYLNGYRYDRFPYGRNDPEHENRITFKSIPSGVRFIKKLGSLFVIIDQEGQLYSGNAPF